MQLDKLIEHVYFHSQEHGDNTLSFLSQHYEELKATYNKEHQEEKVDYEQLPFQSQSQSSSITVFVLNTFKQDLQTPEFLKFKEHIFLPSTFSSLHLVRRISHQGCYKLSKTY